MAADEPGTIEKQIRTDLKQFPVADVLRLLDSLKASFEKELFGGLKWKDSLEDSGFLDKAIEDDRHLSHRVALCRIWKDSLREFARLLKNGESAVKASQGLVRSIEFMVAVVNDLECIESNKHYPEAPFRRMVFDAREGLTARYNDAMRELEVRLKYAVAADTPANVVSIVESDAAIAAPSTSCGASGSVESETFTNEIALAVAKEKSADQTLVSADQFGAFAKAGDKVPDAYKEQGRECGPLEGGKTALAKAVTLNPKAKPDDLKKHHGRKVFVREISMRKLEVFFRSFREFNAAKERLTSANSG